VGSLPTGAVNNDAYIVDEDGNLYVSDGNENWTDAGQIVGPQGPQGSKGDTGDTGPAGTYTVDAPIVLSGDNLSIQDNPSFTGTVAATVFSGNLSGNVTGNLTGTASNASKINNRSLFVTGPTAPSGALVSGDIWIKTS
jgi:hypothetical protein